MIRDVTVSIRRADMLLSLEKMPTRLSPLWRMPASNLDMNLVSSQPPIPASHHSQPSKKYRRIFARCEKSWDNLESSLRVLINPTQTRKP
jgi:hypothetical protein